jgi:polyisoprenoid-binding protein YceI
MEIVMSLPIPAGTYGIDTMHTQLGFSVTHLGISIIRGTFDRFSGWLTVGDGLAGTSVTLEAEMASMNSGNAMRDEHMHGTDFFDVANHPQMVFQSTAITESGSGYAMTGNLTIRSITHPVTLATTYNGSQVFPMDQSTHFGFSASTTISRSAFGVSYGVPMVSDDVKLELAAQFIKPAPTA